MDVIEFRERPYTGKDVVDEKVFLPGVVDVVGRRDLKPFGPGKLVKVPVEGS